MTTTPLTSEELKAMNKQVRKAKRIATEWAGQLHDLVEDRLPAAYDEIPAMAQSTYDACKHWEDLSKQYEAAAASAEEVSA